MNDVPDMLPHDMSEVGKLFPLNTNCVVLDSFGRNVKIFHEPLPS
jgi:hypothetical protein